MVDKSKVKITDADLWDIIDNLHDEIMIFDNDYNMVYVNKAAYRHYGKTPEELINSKFSELDDTYWGDSTLPEVYEKKKVVARRQVTNLGKDIITISVPLLDDMGNIRYVIQNVNDIYTYEHIGNVEEPFVDISNKGAGVHEFVFSSEEMKSIMNTINIIGKVDSPCLLIGETGTGKTLLARMMHNMGGRRTKPFVAINCASVNGDMVETELFGYKGGSLSWGGNEDKEGIIEQANGGTLFIDEISEIPLSMQSKLSGFLETRQYNRVGETKAYQADVKIVAASNRNLKEMVEAGAFRKDLYYRLTAFEVVIPPLRERKDDIRTLTKYFLNLFNKANGKDVQITDGAMEQLMAYGWPGNVRELENIVEKSVVLCRKSTIEAEDLPRSVFSITREKKYSGSKLHDAMAILEKEMVIDAYKKTGSSVGVAAELGISQPTASRMINKYCK